ncbi:MAG: tRNA glutamyl-Q(34) synthetase GluQRS [Boseongicola sp.]
MKTRFAPSPTGPLHLGHAYSAILAHDLARKAGGEFLLRIEDIDQSRARSEWEYLILEDLRWLGLTWNEPVLRQSTRQASYQNALATLWDRRLVFACICNRRDILEAASAPNEGTPASGPDGLIYPGTCRERPRSGSIPKDVALRLDMTAALKAMNNASNTEYPHEQKILTFFEETGHGPNGETGAVCGDSHSIIETIGDVVLARRDIGTSYHLAVVLDDAKQGITHIVRGEDLFEATKIHVVLQRLLGLRTPIYHHHRLIRDDDGKRLAKRDDARSIRTYRDAGATPADIRRMIGL